MKILVHVTMTHLEERARCTEDLDDSNQGDHEDTGQSNQPANHVGPLRIHVVVVSEGLVAQQAEDDDKL